MKREKWSQSQLVVLGILLGVLATAIYDLFKEWLTPILLEGRGLTYSEAMRTFVPVIAAGLSVLILFLLFYKSELLKREGEE